MRRPHAIPGRRAVAEALRAGRPLHELLVDRRGGAQLSALAAAAAAAGVAVRQAGRGELDVAATGVAHQGVVALAPPFAYRDLDLLGDLDLAVVLDGVTDPQNLGVIARSAEAAGAGVLVVRVRRAAGVTPAAEKAAAGALSWLPVARVTNLARTLDGLAERGLWSVGLAAGAAASVFTVPLLDGPVALVVGAEGAGLSRLVAERVDRLAAIPLAGRIESLNAAAAVAVALFEVRRRRQSSG